MKKSIIALSMLVAFGSTSALAATAEADFYKVSEVVEHIKANGGSFRDIAGGEVTMVDDGNGNKYTVRTNGDEIYVTENGRGGVTHKVETNAEGKISKVNGESAHYFKVDDKELPPNPDEEQRNKIQDEKIEKNHNEINEKVDDVARRTKKEIDAIYDEADKASTAAYDVVAKEYTAAAKHVAKQDARISTLEQDFSKMAERQDALEKRVDKVEKKMDSVMAGVHAVTNARPFVQNGQTAVGVGTGFAGSAQSVAIGAAHSFDDSAWSMSASMNVTTGSGVKTDVSGGVGAHYVF
ncbi:YadA-like family protein [Photobacterium swingsii]|uniref:YadA-like family protein n=1 Tax=Photobacterium swingsii TaxID=680026 RepID=UPI0035539186